MRGILRDGAWVEAKVIAEPRHKYDGAPSVLVERVGSMLRSVNGEDLIYLEGSPAISLFTGAGGMDLGLEQAGFVTLCQHEFSGDACRTLIANRPRCFRHSALIQGDIRKTKTTMILRAAGLYIGECHIVCGGPPCQGFSTSNTKSHSGTYDPRNDLVFEFLRVVREAQPKFFLMENVPGFPRFNQSEYLARFLTSAHGANYELVYGLIDACDYGVPQRRCRFICMGTRRDLVEIDGLLGSLPKPTHFADRDLERLRLVEGISSPEARQEYARLTRTPGIRYFPDRKVLVPPSPNHSGPDSHGRAKGFYEFYDKLEREEPDRLVYAPLAGGLTS